MPAAMLGRIRFNTVSGLPVAEYLHREETLFVEPEWSWVPEKHLALIFPSYDLAVAVSPEHRWQDESGMSHLPFVIVCGNQETAAVRERREGDRIATALSSIEPPPVAESAAVPETPANKKLTRVRKPAADGHAPRQPHACGADKWRDVYRSRVSPAESYARLEERHLD